MQTKTLKAIQVLSKIGSIICKIVFICCLIGAICCAAGIVTFAFIPGDLKVGDVTFHALIEEEADISIGTVYAAMAVGTILCAAEAVLSKIAGNYFKNELEAGTPFTFEGAKELTRLGIITICVSIGTAILAGITYAVISLCFNAKPDVNISSGFSSVGLGVTFIITALFFRHGAEISAGEGYDR